MKALLHTITLMAALLFSAVHAAAAAQQGSCAAGAAGGIAQSLFAGSLDGSAPERGDYASDQVWQQAQQDWMGEVTRMAAVIGAIPGFLLSGGDANNVNLASAVAQSGIANNYLNHTETVERVAARARCEAGDASGCQRLQELDDLDRGRDLLLRSRCQSGMTAACRSELVKFESAMFSFQEASKLSYDTEREYLEAVGDAWQELKSEYDSSLQLLDEVRLSNNAVDIVVAEILHQRFTENTNAVLRLIIGAGDAASGAIYGLYDLSDILVNNPAALKAAAEAVIDDPSIIPREMWEPFRLRIAAGDHAGAIGLLGPEVLFAAVKHAGAIGKFATNRTGHDVTATGRPIEFDGQNYTADGFSFSDRYYNYLYDNGRPAPFLQAREVLNSNPVVTPDPQGAAGFFRYEGGGLEMIYNPTTGQVVHLQPIR